MEEIVKSENVRDKIEIRGRQVMTRASNARKSLTRAHNLLK